MPNHATSRAKAYDTTKAAVVIPFPARPFRRNRFRVSDFEQAKEWIERSSDGRYFLEICADASECEEIGDFILVCRTGDLCATFGLARRGHTILLWRSDTHADLGNFANVREALKAITPYPKNKYPADLVLA